MKNLLKNAKNHFITVCTHKYYVGKYCFKAGMFYRGVRHDLSKFHPVEFFESVKYYDGTRSPIDVCKEDIGYSNAWFHHRGRNKHHWEFWCDNFQNGTEPVRMPFYDVLEMFCDFLGAGMAYSKGKSNIKEEIKWWDKKRKEAVIHPHTRLLLDLLFLNCYVCGVSNVLSDRGFIRALENTYRYYQFPEFASNPFRGKANEILNKWKRDGEMVDRIRMEARQKVKEGIANA